MSIYEKIILCVFILGVVTLFIGAGIAMAWMVIEDTALGRAIDEAVGERIEKRKESRKNERLD